MKIAIVVDNKDSWIVPYARELVVLFKKRGHRTYLYHDQQKIKVGDCAFYLGCEKIAKPATLQKNRYNLVVHESALPQGKGWSPLTWQILEGKNIIPITLFEAADKVDSGKIYLQEQLFFVGHELNQELKDAQGKKTVDMCLKFIDLYPNIAGKEQVGQESFYPRRKPEDSELDINKTIAEQFNLLRVADNERYPAFFRLGGKKYIVKIYKS